MRQTHIVAVLLPVVSVYVDDTVQRTYIQIPFNLLHSPLLNNTTNNIKATERLNNYPLRLSLRQT